MTIEEKANRIIEDVRNEKGVNPIIEVDGGINTETAPLAVKAGADMLVAGSAFFKAADKKAFVQELKSIQ